MTQFSSQLQERLIKYFAQKYEIQITSEQADEYLESLAGLCIAMTEPVSDPPPRPPAGRGRLVL